jgi:hypothetical protein
MLVDWARFAGLFAFAMFALVGSLLWALNYPPQDTEWTCKTETEAHQPNHKRVRLLSCRKSQSEKLQAKTASTNTNGVSIAGDDTKVTDKLLVILTGLLVGVGTFQAFYLWGTLKAAAVAANAADLSARAAIAIELPIIRVAPDRFGYGSRQNIDGPRIEYCAIHTLDFSNGGRTRAIPIEVRCGGFIGDKLPDVPAYTFTKSFPINVFFETSPAEPSRLYLSDFEIILATGDTDKLMNRNTTLWFYCCVVYLDFMETQHEVGFCWKRHELFGGGALLADATPAYNRKT